MTKEELQEGNRILAAYEGGSYKNTVYGIEYWTLPSHSRDVWTNLYGGSYEESDEFNLNGLEYDSNWNWLMPVLVKLKEECSRNDWTLLLQHSLNTLNPHIVFYDTVEVIKSLNKQPISEETKEVKITPYFVEE